MCAFLRSFLAALHIWTFTFFPACVQANGIHCLEVISDERIEGLDGKNNSLSRTYYLTLNKFDNDKRNLEKLLHKSIFQANKTTPKVFSLYKNEGEFCLDQSIDQTTVTGSAPLTHGTLNYQLGLEGELIFTLPTDAMGRFEVFAPSRLVVNLGDDRFESIRSSSSESIPFVFQREEKGSWILESAPSELEFFKVTSQTAWVNKASFTVTQPVEIEGVSFQNEGTVECLNGGRVVVDSFINHAKANFSTKAPLEINTLEETLNEGELSIGGPLSLAGASFTNKGTVDINGSFSSSVNKFINYHSIESMQISSFESDEVIFESGSTFSVFGKGKLRAKHHFTQKGSLVGERLSLFVGDEQKNGLFHNEGAIDSEGLLSLTIAGRFLNAEKASLLSRSGSLDLTCTNGIENNGFLGAATDINGRSPTFTSTQTGQLIASQLKIQNAQTISIQHDLNHEEVTLKGQTISLNSIETTHDMFVRGSRSLSLQGAYKSLNGRAFFKAPQLILKNATFVAPQGVRWLTNDLEGVLFPEQKLKLLPKYDSFMKEDSLQEASLLEKMLSHPLAQLNIPIEIILSRGLTISSEFFQNLYFPGNLTLFVPKSSPKGVELSNFTLKTRKGLALRTPYHDMTLGKILSPSHALVTLETEGDLAIEALNLSAPVLRAYGNKSLALHSHKDILFGHFFETVLEKGGVLSFPKFTNDGAAGVKRVLWEGRAILNGKLTFSGTQPCAFPIKYTYSNGSFLASNGGINLVSGRSIQNQFGTIYTSEKGDLYVDAPTAFDNVSAFFNVGKNAFIQTDTFNFINRFDKFETSSRLNFSQSDKFVVYCTYPYISSPFADLQVAGTLTFKINQGMAFTGSIHAKGLITGIETLIFEEKVLQPTFRFDRHDSRGIHSLPSHEVVNGFNTSVFTQKVAPLVSSPTGVKVEDCKQLSLKSSTVQTPLFVAQSETTQIGFQGTSPLPSKKTFTSWNDLTTYLIPGQSLFAESQKTEFLLSPVVSLTFPSHKRPDFVLTPQGDLKETGPYRFLTHPLLETQLISRALSHSLKRTYLETPGGALLQGPQEIRHSALEETQKLTESLRKREEFPHLLPLSPLNSKEQALGHFKKADTPLLLYDLVEYVNQRGKKEKVWAPHFYLPPCYDTNPSLYSGEGGIFVNTFYLDTNHLDFTGVVESKGMLKVMYTQARLAKRPYKWSSTQSPSWKETHTVYGESTHPQSGRLQGGIVELEGKQQNSLFYQESVDIFSESTLKNISKGSLVFKGVKNKAKQDHLVKGKSIVMLPTKAHFGSQASFKKGSQTTESVIHIPSVHESEEGRMLVVSEEGGTRLQGSSVEGYKETFLLSSGTTILEPCFNTTRTESYEKSESDGLLSKPKEKQEVSFTSELIPSLVRSRTKTAGILSKDAITIQGSTLHSEVQKLILSETGDVKFPVTKTLSSYQKQETKTESVWQKQTNEGYTHETLHMPKMTGKGDLLIKTPQGIQVEIKSYGSLESSLTSLGSQSGLEWVKELAQRTDVQWRQVEEYHNSWHFEKETLSPQAATLISLATSLALCWTGIGSTVPSLLSLEAGGMGASMATAGFNTLVSQATVSLVNNQGDISKVLDDLGSSKSVRSLATAVLSAGLTHWGTDALHLPTSSGTDYQEKFFNHLQKNLMTDTIHAGISTVLEGGELDENLLKGLRSAAVGAVSATTANYLGDLIKGQGGVKIDWVSHKVGHGIFGGLTAELLGKDFTSGAVGAVIGEIVGEMQANHLLKKFESGEISTEEELNGALQKTIELARFVSGATVFAMGGDVHIASRTSATAVENNCVQSIIATAKIIWEIYALTHEEELELLKEDICVYITEKTGFSQEFVENTYNGLMMSLSTGNTIKQGGKALLGKFLSKSLNPNSRVRTINDRMPINAEYANKVYPIEKLPLEIRKKYPHSVPFTGTGHPDFSRYAMKKVPINMTGIRDIDEHIANKIVGWKVTPNGYTWHHHHDGKTMMLVPRKLHDAIRHTGGVAIVKNKNLIK